MGICVHAFEDNWNAEQCVYPQSAFWFDICGPLYVLQQPASGNRTICGGQRVTAGVVVQPQSMPQHHLFSPCQLRLPATTVSAKLARPIAHLRQEEERDGAIAPDFPLGRARRLRASFIAMEFCGGSGGAFVRYEPACCWPLTTTLALPHASIPPAVTNTLATRRCLLGGVNGTARASGFTAVPGGTYY